jgi:predicted DNA-binding protein
MSKGMLRHIITFKVDDELLQLLNTMSKAKGIPRSKIIREAVEFYLKNVFNIDIQNDDGCSCKPKTKTVRVF